MKKLSAKQKNDLFTIKYFIPPLLKNIKITDNDIEDFFNYSDRGIKSKKETLGYEALKEGKRWRGIHIHEMYEQGILEGSIPYIELLENMPRQVVDFLKREMFKGIDSKTIDDKKL